MTREQQIELMKESVADAIEVLRDFGMHIEDRKWDRNVLKLGRFFFQYRTRQRDAKDIPAQEESGCCS